jgi:AcrR family transcriptional regulator
VTADAPSRRERQAAATRLEIVAAARPLLATQGYAKTSVAQIAAAAGVSVQTIYDSLGSKAAIVRALNDLIDVESDIPRLAGAIPTTDDPAALIGISVSIARNICARCEDIVAAITSAASVEPELLAVLHEGQRRHRQGVAGIAARLDALGALADGVSSEHAADVIGVLTDVTAVRMFVVDYGWSLDQYADWANDALARLVLKPRRNR